MLKQIVGNPDTSFIFDMGTGKRNKGIKYISGDNFSKTKVYSNESYAQELYEKYARHFNSLDNCNVIITKDLDIDEVYKVIITNVDFQNKIIRSEIIGSGTPIFIPFSEFHIDKNDIVGNEYTIIVYNNVNGVYYGSFKKFAQIDYLKEVIDAYANKDWFYVKIKSLIDGGYIAEYKDTVQCFLPGGQAAANIIKDFDELIGKTIAVMVDSYDSSSKLYIVSHKKYIKKVLPIKIKDLEFGKKYIGTLTSRPTNFGLFVEIDKFFTGLIYPTDFADYDEIKMKMKAFDEIDVYINDIVTDKENPNIFKIILTTNPTNINWKKAKYHELNTSYKSRILNYTFNKEKSTITIETDGDDITIPVHWPYVEKYIEYGYKHIVIRDVDVIKEKVYLDFMR